MGGGRGEEEEEEEEEERRADGMRGRGGMTALFSCFHGCSYPRYHKLQAVSTSYTFVDREYKQRRGHTLISLSPNR